MGARRSVRRLVGLLLFVGTLLSATPALAGITGIARATGQDVTAGTWRLILSTTSTPASASGTVSVRQDTTNYVYLVNTGGKGIPVSYSVAVSVVSTDGSPITLTACVGGTWTSSASCSGTATVIGSTSGITRFTAGTVAPAGSSTLPVDHAVHVRVTNSSVTAVSSTGRANPSVAVTSG